MRDGFQRKMKHPQNLVMEAVNLYAEMSFRDIAMLLKAKHGVQVTHVTVANWVTKYYADLNPLPCPRCLFMEDIKARTCDVLKCPQLDEWLGVPSILEIETPEMEVED